ncbi:hypothetical protein ACQ4PT_008738 [Festuca glaucescens]
MAATSADDVEMGDGGTPVQPNTHKRNSDDMGWEWGVNPDPNDKTKVKCLLCGHESTGGINRFKHHLGHVGNVVSKCKKVSEEVKARCRANIEETSKKKREKAMNDKEVREGVLISAGHTDGEESQSRAGSSVQPSKLGPMDKFTRPIDPKATRAEALKQQNINEALNKERTQQTARYVARWMYTHAIPFNAIDNDEFVEMVEAIGCFGPGFKPPSPYDLRETLLKAEYARTQSFLKDREEDKLKNGCTIMTDAWTDMKRRSIMNLCTNTSEGTTFMKSKEMSDVSHTSDVIFTLVDKAIEEAGPDHVVQVVTDNASNNMGAKTMLKDKRPNILWSSCATHTINLMLQGIGNLPKFKKTIDQAKSFTIFVYGHHRTLSCMRSFTKKKEIIRPGVTRFASSFLTLQSMLDKRDQLRRMVVDQRWETLADVFEPLVKVLHLVDGDVKPSMGFLYGELLKAKRDIRDAFGNVEKNYKDVMAIVDKKMKGRLDSPLHVAAYMLNPYYSYNNNTIFDDPNVIEKFMLCAETFYHHDDDKAYAAVNVDLDKFQKKHDSFSKKLAKSYEKFEFNPASWWRLYGGGAPDLQRMAVRILSLTSSSSGCERNWSTFESIHTKKRNRLTIERMDMLTNIQFNNRMLSKKERRSRNKSYEVLLAADASEAQGFLFEGGDAHALMVFHDPDEGYVPGTNIPWSVLGEAVGADEQLQPRRSARVVREINEEEWESADEDGEEEDNDFDDDEAENDIREVAGF